MSVFPFLSLGHAARVNGENRPKYWILVHCPVLIRHLHYISDHCRRPVRPSARLAVRPQFLYLLVYAARVSDRCLRRRFHPAPVLLPEDRLPQICQLGRRIVDRLCRGPDRLRVFPRRSHTGTDQNAARQLDRRISSCSRHLLRISGIWRPFFSRFLINHASLNP